MKPEIHYIYITDVELHSNVARNPTPWYTKVLKAIKGRKEGRFYGNKIEFKEGGGFRIPFNLPPALQKEKEEAEAQGKVVEFILPKGGVPIYLGKDAAEK